MQIYGKTFLVTGGASGLGAATSRRLLQHGARVIIADLDREAGQQLAGELGSDARFVFVDVTDAACAEMAVNVAKRDFGGLHGAVNCAGIAPAAKIVSGEGPHDLELFARVIQVNLIGTFNVLRVAADAMKENPPDAAGERGVIINTSSVAAFEAQIGQTAYAASKGGVASMTLPAARELARHGIRVVAIAPGVFRTPLVEAMPAKVFHSLSEQALFPPRLGEPNEFASLVQHIIENQMLNGCVLRLDGAVRLGPK